MSPLSRGLLLASQLASHFAKSTITNTKSAAQSASIALYSSSKPVRIALWSSNFTQLVWLNPSKALRLQISLLLFPSRYPLILIFASELYPVPTCIDPK